MTEKPPAAAETPESSGAWQGQLGNTAEEVWQNAASAAIHSVASLRLNATTVLLPSGAGDIEVGFRVVMGLISRMGPPFRAVVVMPGPLLEYASKLYQDAASEQVQVVGVEHNTQGIRKLAACLTAKANTVVVLAKYEDLPTINMAQLLEMPNEQLEPEPIELLLFEAAHIVRAGGYREAGVTDGVVTASQRVYLSARQLAGRAPGALLAPGQEPGFPKEELTTKFGPEVFRLTRVDAEQRMLTVPLRLLSLSSANATDVAQELAKLHERLGVRGFKVVPPQPRLAEALDKILKRITGGGCRAMHCNSVDGPDVDAILIAGSTPDYAAIAEEFTRLARWAPGKQHGYVLATAMAKPHVVAAWRALAIEDASVEEAIQRAAVEAGRKDQRLKWDQVPQDMRRIIFEGSERQEEAEVAVARGIDNLADPWDTWLGRLAAFKDRHGHARPRLLGTIFGHELGPWVRSQRERWEAGLLDERKTARLKAMGLMLDLDAETFAQGLAELRRFVVREKTRLVPISYCTQGGFRLGEWVVQQRTKQRRAKLNPYRQKMLRDAFFTWRPSEAPSIMFNHPNDPHAAEVTQTIEAELKSFRWQPMSERRRQFRKLVLHWHPDVSDSDHADDAITFLAEVKDWFLAGH